MPKIMGSVIVVAGFFLLNGQMEESSGNLFGVVCGIMAAVLFAVFIILNKKAETITGLEKSVIQIVSCFLTVAVYVLIKQGISIQVAADDWLPILILGIVNTGFGAAIYYASMGKLSTQTVSVCGYIEPLSAVIFSFFILKERMTVLQIAGGILILGGALFAEWSGLKKSEKE